MLKYEIESTEGLDENIAGLYQKSDDGKFRLAVDGLEDTSALKRARDHEKEQRFEAQRKAAEVEKQLQELQDQIEQQKNDNLKKGGKFEELEARLEKKRAEEMAAMEAKYKAEIEARDEGLKKSTKASVVDSIASDIGKNPKALRPHLESRIQIEVENGVAKTIFLDDTGNPSELTKERFVQEFSKTDYLSDLIIGSKGSGGGASGSGDGGGASSDSKKIDLTKATAKQGVEALRSKVESA